MSALLGYLNRNSFRVTPQSPVFTSLSVGMTGKAEPGADVLMEISGYGSPQVIATADANGVFSAMYAFDPALQGSTTPLTLTFTTRIGSQTSVSGVTRYVFVSLPPVKPTGLATEVLDTRIRLSWTRNTEQSVVSYNVYRNGNQVPYASVAQSGSGSPSFLDLALTDGPTYTYQVEAVDGRGNKSEKSDPVSASCAAGGGWGP
ncbi:MAG: fibronectin type III domain-containing protein, partial [Candidatus Coatesbacteria bacterium]